jgi:CheY-like chemotaxis protein
MDAATAERAVEPFFTTRGLEGSGLGLSMVQGFAEQSGGTMSISSAPGQGTRVVLELPAAAAKPAVAAPPEQPGQTRRIDSILLVDDDADVLLTTGAFLESAGFKVIQAANAEAALALLEHGVAIDAVLTDYAMPGLNGSDLIKRARATRAGLPGVIITGLTDVADMDALGVGTVTLRKPFPRASLISALRSLGTLPDAAEPLHASTAAELDQASPAAGA